MCRLPRQPTVNEHQDNVLLFDFRRSTPPNLLAVATNPCPQEPYIELSDQNHVKDLLTAL